MVEIKWLIDGCDISGESVRVGVILLWEGCRVILCVTFQCKVRCNWRKDLGWSLAYQGH